MAGKIKYDWNAIIADIENGMNRKSVCKKYNVDNTLLSHKISHYYPHLLLPRGVKEGCQPPQPKVTNCPVMLKIDAIRLFNKRTPIPDIAKQLSIKIQQVREILACAKKRIGV